MRGTLSNLETNYLLISILFQKLWFHDCLKSDENRFETYIRNHYLLTFPKWNKKKTNKYTD